MNDSNINESGCRIADYDGVKIFTATKALERTSLGDDVTRWLEENDDIEIVDTVVRQSSDQQFHCLTILIFYRR